MVVFVAVLVTVTRGAVRMFLHRLKKGSAVYVCMCKKVCERNDLVVDGVAVVVAADVRINAHIFFSGKQKLLYLVKNTRKPC